MRGHKMPAAHASHPNVTPLIDIVMCLIIFYMLVAKIGVNTGQMLSGNLGSAQRFDYAITGDAVNFGSRLEGMNKQFHTSILMSEATYLAAQPAEPVQFRGEIQVRGRAQPVPVYSIGPVPSQVEAAPR